MTDLLTGSRAARSRVSSVIRALRTSPASAPALVGLLGLGISLAGIGVPSVWYDEAATITAATRSLPQLWELVGHVDAVHALYYLFLHFVFDVFGYSPLTLRAPSAVAVGVAAAATVVLARSFGSSGVAVLSGVTFCLLPRVTWMGIEGRSYAMSAALAVLLTLVFVRAIQRGSVRTWSLYALLAVVSCTVFIYLSLIVVAHGCTMAWLLLAERQSATPIAVRWAAATAAAVVLVLPLVVEVISQDEQLSWIDPLGPDTATQVFQDQWFLYSPEFATAGCLLMAFGVWVLLRRSRGLAVVVLPLLVVPTVALLAATELYTPLYSPRYLTMCTPFVGITIAAGIRALPSRSLVAATVAALIVLAVPATIEQRLPRAKQNSTWAEVARLIAVERAEDPVPTAILYGPVRYHATASTRVIAYAYPEPFKGTTDVKLETPAAESGQLWEKRRGLENSLDRLEGSDVTYLITSVKQDVIPGTTGTLTALGWRVEDSWNLGDVNVVKYARDAAPE